MLSLPIGTSLVSAVVASTEGSGEEPSVLLPAAYDIIWGGVSFAIVFLLFWQFVLPRMNATLAERTDRIEGGMARAEQMQAEAKAQLAAYKAQLTSAQDEAAVIREKAQAEKAHIIEAARRDAAEAAAQVNASALAQLDAEKSKVMSEVRREAGTVAADLAERIVGENLDAEKSRNIVDRFIAELENSQAGRS